MHPPTRTSRDAIARTIADINHAAKRKTPVVGSPEHPTDWDDVHALINSLLDDWQHAPA